MRRSMSSAIACARGIIVGEHYQILYAYKMSATDQSAPAPAVRMDVAALIAALVTVTLWGSAFVAIRDAGRTLSPGSLALGRLLVALVVLGAAAWIWREPLPRRRDLMRIAAFGVLFLG